MHGTRAMLAGGAVALAVSAAWWMWPRPPEPPASRGAALEVLSGAPRARPSAPAGAPHVVLLIGCTVRRDQLGLYGGPPGITPWMDALAARGARVDGAIAAAPWTRPATAALITGRHALELGMVEPGPARNARRLPESAVTLAEALADAGWTTLGATANPNLHAAYGFEQGFDRYLQPDALWTQTELRVEGQDLVSGVVGMLDTRPDPERPVFLQVLLVDAHAPFQVGPEVAKRYAGDGVPDRVARYRAALHGLDERLAALDRAITERLGDAPIVRVFVADHGEGLSWPEHHGRSHGRYLYDSTVDVPWLASGPGIPPGTVVTGVASQIDVAPTILGLAGLPVPASPDPDDARDLSAALRSGGPTGRERAFSDTWYATASRSAVRTDRWACLRDHVQDEPPAPSGRMIPGCSDRATDPHHERPVPEPPEDLLAALDAWRATRLARAPAPETARGGDELDEHLRALGYVDVPE